MDHYIAESEIPVLERAAAIGNRTAAERLLRFYDHEIAALTAKRAALAARVDWMDTVRRVTDECF